MRTSGTLVTAVSAFVFAQDGSAVQAANPLASWTVLNFQNPCTPDLTGVETDANQFILRYARPFVAFGGRWIAPVTLPVNSLPKANGGHATGIGDFNAFAGCLSCQGDEVVMAEVCASSRCRGWDTPSPPTARPPARASPTSSATASDRATGSPGLERPRLGLRRRIHPFGELQCGRLRWALLS